MFLFGFPVRRTGYTPTATAATVHGRGGRRGRGRQRRGAPQRGPRWPGPGRLGRHVRPTPTAAASRPQGPPKHGRRCRSGGSGRGRAAPPSPSATASGAPPTAAATAPRVCHVPLGGCRGRRGRHAAEPRVAGCRWRYARQQSHVRRRVRRRPRSSETRQGFHLRVSPHRCITVTQYTRLGTRRIFFKPTFKSHVESRQK